MTVGWLAMIRVLVIARSKATWQSIFQVVQDSRWIASPSARNDGGRLAVTEGVACSAPDSSHCEEHSDVAIHTNHVIARSVATWQSTHPLSLRGAKRRGNLFFRWCKTQDGLLRLRLAMTPIPVIARSKATWQSIFQVVQDDRWIASPSARNDVGWLAMIRVLVIARSVATWQSTHPLSLRGAKRRGNPYFRWCKT